MPEPSPTGAAPVLQVHPTRRCNLACRHCYTSSGPRVDEALAPGLLRDCLDDAMALGYRQLALSGGEPLLYDALRELLVHARGLGMSTTLTTNGMLATPARWGPLAAWLDAVAVSVDGTPAEHDALRGKAGAFDRTLAGLRVIRDSGVAFGLIFTLTQHNVDSLGFIVRLAAELGARGVQVHPLAPAGRATQGLADAQPDGLELLAALVEAQRLAAQLGVAVYVDALDCDQIRGHRRQLVPQRPVAALCDVAPVLIVRSDAQVVPLTHEVDQGLWLGSLQSSRLSSMAAAWLASGQGDRLAAACERSWADLAADETLVAAEWYDAVAAQTRPRARWMLQPLRTEALSLSL